MYIYMYVCMYVMYVCMYVFFLLDDLKNELKVNAKACMQCTYVFFIFVAGEVYSTACCMQ